MKPSECEKRVPSYRLHWCIALTLLAFFAVGIFVNRHHSKSDEGIVPATQGVMAEADWFLLVRCPEMPMEAGGAEAGRMRLSEWINAARESGFHPSAFPEVLKRLQHGELIPEDTLVLMFDPSYRNTVEQLLPTLESLHVPALWVTRSPGRVRADRRFVTGHTRRTLSAGALCDFAVQNDEDTLVLEKASAGHSLPRIFKWQSDLGVTGVNTGTNLTGLNRLHANARWSAQEFVDRLKADVPLRHRSGFSVRQVDKRLWGILLPQGQEERFDLQVPLDRRYCSVTWQGTRGIQDIELNLTIGSWFGEAWVYLRSDREMGDRVRVGLMENRMRILQEVGGVVVDDRDETCPIRPSEGLRLNLVLVGDNLSLSGPSLPASVKIPVRIRGSSESRVEFSLYHRIHGAAGAEALTLTATPLQLQTDSPVPEGIVAADHSPTPGAN